MMSSYCLLIEYSAVKRSNNLIGVGRHIPVCGRVVPADMRNKSRDLVVQCDC